ncbi:hypothetical protein JYU34_000315 [Plutella xylostella]|uniref:ABC1 atypical kinase-like domain-containing protein n=1 Tax=Plutella xylostella TaxID=51655 RepID=A0ABQ7R7H9_PLUXY|nr:hypothetical protein JYU34_000315 [Plutella xylostella]
MSHINDLIAVVRGLRLVAEAGVKLQQEHSRTLWNNSSIKSVLLNCSTNQLTALKPNPEGFKDVIDRALVVAHGFRKYAALQIPNLDVDIDKSPDMDPQLKSEIEELNREFNKTFESLESAVEGAAVRPPPFPVEAADTVEKVKVIPKEPPVQPVKSMAAPEPSPSIVHPHSPPVPKPQAKKKISVSLSKNSKARVVPSSRVGRMLSFGGLAAGLGVGTLAQYARNTFQAVSGHEDPEPSHAFLSPANAERIVDTLCKVRGAALKLGQLLSIQDESVISPELQKIFERVRQSADFMPAWQVDKVMTTQLGPEWRSLVKSFEDKPFAAASIGQVHLATLHNGQEVAIKIQYPGVAKGIDSDIDNLVGVMKVWNMFPKGMFIDNIVQVAKKELSWEVDYLREAECTKKFKQLLAPYPEYFVPDVVDSLCSQEVMTTELIEGTPLDQLFEVDYATRHDIAYKIMRLCLHEMFVFRCMQTDPNWANFFYNTQTKQVVLLDFGATREYSREFMDEYIEVIRAAADDDREKVLTMSRQMKLLTGYESKIMEETHVDTVMIMGEVFTSDGEFDFGTQKTTRRIQALVPTILNHRLCPPPEEIYSLHRKLSGVFLLCSKMKIKMNCRVMFEEVYEQYKNQALEGR